jgi:RNA polymerase sigma-70 factor (ECF subfamily)
MTESLEQIYDSMLVVRCQAGDEAAFEELVARYAPRLRYFLRKLLGNAESAEDCLQDVWLSAFRGLCKLADAQALRAWLYRIARDRAFAVLRRAGRAEQLTAEAEVPDTLPEEPAFTAEDAAAIHAALDRLPPEQREALVLRFLETMSYEEIARATGQALGTVRSRIHYGKQALARLLEPQVQHD